MPRPHATSRRSRAPISPGLVKCRPGVRFPVFALPVLLDLGMYGVPGRFPHPFSKACAVRGSDFMSFCEPSSFVSNRVRGSLSGCCANPVSLGFPNAIRGFVFGRVAPFWQLNADRGLDFRPVCASRSHFEFQVALVSRVPSVCVPRMALQPSCSTHVFLLLLLRLVPSRLSDLICSRWPCCVFTFHFCKVGVSFRPAFRPAFFLRVTSIWQLLAMPKTYVLSIEEILNFHGLQSVECDKNWEEPMADIQQERKVSHQNVGATKSAAASIDGHGTCHQQKYESRACSSLFSVQSTSVSEKK